MRNKEIAKGLRLIAEGFTTLAVAYEKEDSTEPKIVGVDLSKESDAVVNNTVDTSTGHVVNQEVVEPVQTTEEVKETTPEVKDEVKPEGTSIPTEQELNALSYNEIKAKAKELGIKAVGSKKVIIENILALNNNVEETTDETPVEETTPTESPNQDDIEEAVDNTEEIPSEDRGEEIDLSEESPEDEEELPEEANTIYDKVAKDLEGYTDEELADILSDIGVSPKGRRQALLAKIVQAIEDGKLEWEDDFEEVEGSEEVLDLNEDDFEVPSNGNDTESDQEDFKGTETRKQSCYEECDKIEEIVAKGEISHKQILKFLKEYHNGKYVSLGEESDLEEYMAINCDLIDDEGNKHELSDPYYIGDDVFCCGKQLKDLDNDLFCEVCGTTYVSE